MICFRVALFRLIAIVATLASSYANAGRIYLIGDVTPIFDLTGRVLNHRVHSGNVQLFKNLRQRSQDGASSILILSGRSNESAVRELDYFYTSINDIVRIEETITGSVLIGVGLLVILRPKDRISQDETDAIRTYLKSCGDLLLMGDLAGDNRRNVYINNLLADLGSSMSIDLTKGTTEPFSFWFSDNPLLTDVTSIKLGAARIIRGGTPLAFVGRNNEAIFAYEEVEQ